MKSYKVDLERGEKEIEMILNIFRIRAMEGIKKQTEVQNRIDKMKEKDRSIEKVLETIEKVRKYSDVEGLEMATVMEHALDIGEDQDWFKFSREEIKDWREKLKAKKEEELKVIRSDEEYKKIEEWLLRDSREVEGKLMEFMKGMKIKKQETLGTKGELDKVEKVGIGDNQETEILREIRIQLEKETLVEEEGELREEIEQEVGEPEDVFEDAGVDEIIGENKNGPEEEGKDREEGKEEMEDRREEEEGVWQKKKGRKRGKMKNTIDGVKESREKEEKEDTEDTKMRHI